MSNTSLLLIHGTQITTNASKLTKLISEHKCYNQQTKDITDEFAKTINELKVSIEHYNHLGYLNNQSNQSCSGCISDKDIFPKTAFCNIKKNALFFSSIYEIKFPQEILDSKNFIHCFSNLIQAIWYGVLKIKSSELALVANTFKTTIDDMTRKDYLIISCPDEIKNKQLCYQIIAPLLCNYNQIMPRIIMFDSLNSGNTASNMDTLSDYIDGEKKINAQQGNLCKNNVIKAMSNSPIVGGNMMYYKKYQKYKSKYLQSKQ